MCKTMLLKTENAVKLTNLSAGELSEHVASDDEARQAVQHRNDVLAVGRRALSRTTLAL